MAEGQARPVTRADLERAVRAVANHFKADRVFIIGSQALLVGQRDIERSLWMSKEFDVYLGNAKEWEASQGEPIEASEGGIASAITVTFAKLPQTGRAVIATFRDRWAEDCRIDPALHGRAIQMVCPEVSSAIFAVRNGRPRVKWLGD